MMTQEETSAAMDALHNDLIDLFRKHSDKLPADRPSDAPFAFATACAVILGGIIANDDRIKPPEKLVLAQVIMKEVGKYTVMMSIAPKQEARQ